MEYDLTQMTPTEGYRLLTSLVVPRPIAWVTSLDAGGIANVAPYSFFNLMGSDPPIVAIGVGNRKSGDPKDTAANAMATGAFVVNLVDDGMAEAMNVTAIEFPAGVSEAEEAGLPLIPSARIPIPRLQDAPVSLECRLAEVVTVGRNRVLFGEVLYIHLRDGETPDSIRFIARMGGGGGYTRTSDRFQMPRIALDEWEARKGTR